MNVPFEKVVVLQRLAKHTSDITSCDFAPNFTLVTGSSDKTVRLWEWIPGTGYSERPYSPLKGHKYGVTCVRVSPQGSMLATTSIDGTAILWNLHSGMRIHTMVQVNGDAIRVCRFAPDSSILVTAGDNGAICVWDLIHRTLLRSIFQHEGTTQALAFTPDSQYLVSACSLEIIYVWHVQNITDTAIDSSPTPSAVVDNAHDLGILCLDVSNIITADEDDALTKRYTLATSGNSHDIKIWTITSRATPKMKNVSKHVVTISYTSAFEGHMSAVTCVKYNNNGSLLISCSLDKLIKIWDSNGVCLCTLNKHTRYVNCVAFSRDTSMVVSGSNDKNVLVWDLTGGTITLDSELVRSLTHLTTLFQNANDIQESEVVRNAESDDNCATLIEKLDDIADGAINSCCFSGDELLVTGSSDKLVRLFKVTGENNNIEEASYSPFEGHTYAVNQVEFSRNGSLLVSCSLDGCTIIWNPLNGEKILELAPNSLAVKCCRFSSDASLLITAGDDELATVWDVKTATSLIVFEGHSDAITSACFSPDNSIIATSCSNGDFRLWTTNSRQCVHVQDNAHDLGVQNCDFSENLEPIPNTNNLQNYLLATCGNDAMVNLWRISTSRNNANRIDVKIWRHLQGHGGSVVCVRFSPNAGELVCSTGSDRQTRIWSIYSAECLHVLEHDSMTTSCSFSATCSMLAVGCLDKTLWLWKLPQQIVFQTTVINKLKIQTKAIIDWSTQDIVKWLTNVGLSDVITNAVNASLDGQRLLTLSEERICSGLGLDGEHKENLTREIKWLKQDELIKPSLIENREIPDEFLCPITHEIMREPVKCSDGFTYEKRAITEWFMAGKYTSPMTNVVLSSTTDLENNKDLRNAIHTFLYQDK